MTTTEATSATIQLVPDRTVMCDEQYHSTHHGSLRTEGLECRIAVLPSLSGQAACQSFTGPSFEACISQIAQAKATVCEV